MKVSPIFLSTREMETFYFKKYKCVRLCKKSSSLIFFLSKNQETMLSL